jgi:hypothetical protein
LGHRHKSFLLRQLLGQQVNLFDQLAPHLPNNQSSV